MNENRVNEAIECIKKAEKYLKTSLTKWKPDYDSAAVEYDRAAICYKNAKKYDESMQSFLNSSDCHEKNGNAFHAAKGKEQAALIAKEAGDPHKATELMEQAAKMYAESGSTETSAMALDKAARFLEQLDPVKAIVVYEKAVNLVSDADRSRMCGEFLRRITYCYLKLENFAKAADNVKREIDLYKIVDEPAKVGKLTAGLIIIDLAREDPIEAEKDLAASYRVKGFEDTGDAPILKPLIDAYCQGDEEKFQKILNHPHIKANDNEILRLMKKIKLPASEKAISQQEDGQESKNDDDYSGLC